MTFLLNLAGFVAFVSGAAWLATLAGASASIVTGLAVTMLLAGAVVVVAAAIGAGERDPA